MIRFIRSALLALSAAACMGAASAADYPANTAAAMASRERFMGAAS